MPSRPNLLLILSDEHSPHVLGCSGDRVVRTPHLDRLAERGVRFTNTYCGSPLCVPSRMTFLTSRHCSDIGVWSNSCTMDSEIPTFNHPLNAAGYRTILCGRMNFGGPDQRHGFQARLIGDVTQARKFPGPDRNVMHPIPRGTVGQNKAAVEVAGPGRTAFQAYDDAVTDACCRFLRERDSASESQPFAMVVGTILPHCPFICPPDLYHYYHDRIDVPELPGGYLDRLHPAALAYRQRRKFDELTDDQVRAARAAYYGLVEYEDRLDPLRGEHPCRLHLRPRGHGRGAPDLDQEQLLRGGRGRAHDLVLARPSGRGPDRGPGHEPVRRGSDPPGAPGRRTFASVGRP
jgi:choline-sulfatase